jgi:hypothetical protein
MFIGLVAIIFFKTAYSPPPSSQYPRSYTLLLQKIHEMLKKAMTNTTMMSEASRRPSNTFSVLNDKGGEISIKA